MRRRVVALPVTQHDRVWAIYLEFVRSDERIPGDTARRVYRRYLKFEPGHAEEYVEFLNDEVRGETAAKLAELVDDDAFQSLAGKSKHAMWLELCDIITKHPAEVHEYSAGRRTRLDVDAVLRGGIRTFSGETGRLWTALADYYIRRGLFEKARDVYEEGMESVATVRDFSLIFDAYAQFEESVISAKMENEDEDEDEDDDSDSPESFVLRSTATADLELRLARLEHLMERRPILLSSVAYDKIRVHEWEKRVALFEGDPTRQIVTYSDAVKTVNPHLATGRVSALWINFAKFLRRRRLRGAERFSKKPSSTPSLNQPKTSLRCGASARRWRFDARRTTRRWTSCGGRRRRPRYANATSRVTRYRATRFSNR